MKFNESVGGGGRYIYTLVFDNLIIVNDMIASFTINPYMVNSEALFDLWIESVAVEGLIVPNPVRKFGNASYLKARSIRNVCLSYFYCQIS